MIDLHSHTTASDGSLTPAELAALAAGRGLTCLGITDHDTIGGLAEAEQAAAAVGLELVPGVEISVDYSGGEFHLLGYFIDYRNALFLDRLSYLQENRFNRNQVMLRKMRDLGFEMTMADIEAEAGGGQIGRPHMARALLKKGYVDSVQEAFNRYLADGQPLHVPKVKLAPPEAIDLVHLAGGAAVLAHPRYLGFDDPADLEVEIEQLAGAGLDGLECYYSQHSEAQTRLYLEIATRHDLVVTAGSDFHGISKPDVELGTIYQGRAGDSSLLEPLRESARSHAGG